MGEAFYEPDGGGRYLPTGHTEGPWDPDFQHGGPPAALLTRAIEQHLAAEGPTGSGLTLARLTCDILGPIPRLPLRVETRLGRPGRRVQLVHATLSHGDRPLIQAAAWAVSPAPDQLPPSDVPAEAPATGPGDAPEDDPTANPEWRCGFLAATEWRFVRGHYAQPGPATVWMRPRVPLLPGEPMSPMQRVALTADSANGVSAVLDITKWTFIPPELTIHLMRPPRGEWLCLEAESFAAPGCVGLATSVLHDEYGPVARSAQAMLVAAR